MIVESCPKGLRDRTLAGLAALVLNLVPAAAAAQSVVHAFIGYDGSSPRGGLINVGGTFYGVTSSGGIFGKGTVFSISSTGQPKVLFTFGATASDAAAPQSTLIRVGTILYGTSTEGGAGTCNCGTVFSVTLSGQVSVLYSFQGGTDGSTPMAGVANVNGVLYGTTAYGGANGRGTVFALTLTGAESVLHSFGAAGDGINPMARLENITGTLYGTTYEGGSQPCSCGTVFSVTPTGTETILYSFAGHHDGGPRDGSMPMASLTDVGGVLYGTTSAGGLYNYGTVFSVTTAGSEAVLHSFRGYTKHDGAQPLAEVTEVNNVLYGTTNQGGSEYYCDYGCGLIYSLTLKGRVAILGGVGGSAAGLDYVGSSFYGTSTSGYVFSITP